MRYPSSRKSLLGFILSISEVRKDSRLREDSRLRGNYMKSIKVAIAIIIAFSIKVASVIGNFKAVPKQAH